MKKIWIFLTLVMIPLFSEEYLPQKYFVEYGDSSSPVKIIEYFSFSCPHCIALFREDFATIKEKYIEEKKIYFVFHPIPMDLLTVQAMDCLEKLSYEKKQVFLEAILDSIDITDPELSTQMMIRAMEIFEQPIPHLSQKEYLSNTNAFKDAYECIIQDDVPEALPSVAINQIFLPKEIPNEEFIRRNL